MRVRNAAEFGQLVRSERLRQALTQAQLAARHGATQRWISLVEGGKDATQLGPALRLLRTLGMSLEARPLARSPTKTSTLSDVVAAHLLVPSGARKRRGR